MSSPSFLLRYVKLPGKLENGTFDRLGRKVGDPAAAAVVLHALPGGPWQCWGVFDRDLERGQYGALTFTNVPGDAVPGGAFTEWDRGRAVPDFDDERLMVLYSVQRAPGSARIIGRNDSGRRTAAAAAVLFVPPPPGSGGGGGARAERTAEKKPAKKQAAKSKSKSKSESAKE